MQLCLAEELSNCTLDLYSNDVCDPECDTIYCMRYIYGTETFSNPATLTRDNGTLYAADAYHCEYIVTEDAYPRCNESTASESIYIDRNVPQDKYKLCQLNWIGDGMVIMLYLYDSLILVKI